MPDPNVDLIGRQFKDADGVLLTVTSTTCWSPQWVNTEGVGVDTARRADLLRLYFHLNKEG